MLGYKTYHGESLFEESGHPQIWSDYFENGAPAGESPPFRKLLAGYDAVLDLPCAKYHKELRAMFPNAVVIHTQRDADKWISSVMNFVKLGEWVTKNQWFLKFFLPVNSQALPFAKAYQQAVAQETKRDTYCREHFLNLYADHNARMNADPEVFRFDPSEGWEKLCAVLKVEVPEVPYPRLNSGGSLVMDGLMAEVKRCVFYRYVLPLCVIVLGYFLFTM